MGMIFAWSLDLADQYLWQFIQGIFPFLYPPGIISVFASPPLPHPSVISSSCKPVTAQLTLQNEKSKIKIMLGDRIVCTNKQWQKPEKPFQENRTIKGEEYHPSTLYNIAMMIQIYINERVDNTIKIMENNDFHGFRTNKFSFFWSCI